MVRLHYVMLGKERKVKKERGGRERRRGERERRWGK